MGQTYLNGIELLGGKRKPDLSKFYFLYCPTVDRIL